MARRIRHAPALTGRSVLAAAFNASPWSSDRLSAHSWAMIESMRSRRLALGQRRPPFFPLSRAGFGSPSYGDARGDVSALAVVRHEGRTLDAVSGSLALRSCISSGMPSSFILRLT